MHKYLKILLDLCFCLSFCITVLAKAEDRCELGGDDCDEVGRWQLSMGVGLGARTNPLVDSKNIPLILIPQISYTGEHFFIQNLDVGFILLESEWQQLNLFMTPSYDPIYFYNNHPGNYFFDSQGFTINNIQKVGDVVLANNGNNPGSEGPQAKVASWRDLHTRRTAGLAGLEYSLTLNQIDFQAQVVHDITGVHDGDEIRLTLAKHWQKGKHRLSLAVGANWQDSAVINYYYGLSAQETDAASIYTASSGISTLARFDWNYKVTEDWDLRFFTSYRQLPTAISASPLVKDDKVITAFVGGVYHF